MVRISDLSVSFGEHEAVKKVNIEIKDGEILGLVGESGSGKSVTALTMMGLEPEGARLNSGRILYDDEELRNAGRPKDHELYRTYRGKNMAMVFQEPMTSLNPTKRVGWQVDEMLKLHTDWDKEKRTGEVYKTMERVGLKDVEKIYKSYPHQLSGGMRQRVMIAIALVLHPGLIVCDEPTTALDVSVQNQIITLLRKINDEEKNSMLFITHDLNLARRLCDRIAVMKDGRIVECDKTEKIFLNPSEEYTKKLIEAVPSRLKASEEISPDLHIDVNDCVLKVSHLNVYYKQSDNSILTRGRKRLVVKDADFKIYRGEILGLVGESGCGKTTLSKAILGMNKLIDGSIEHKTTHPQMIFQDPYSSLNPSKTIGWLLEEPLRCMDWADKKIAYTKDDVRIAAMEMLKTVGLPEYYYNKYPNELSGGERQRVSIGQALITKPGLVIADEPVSALDVTIQAQIMDLMLKLQSELKLAYLFISHDLNVVYKMSDRILVMKDGVIVEQGDTDEVFFNPKEEYTKSLMEDDIFK